MHEARLVHRGQHVQQRRQQAVHVLRGKRAVLVEFVGQGGAVNQLHDDVSGPMVLDQVIDVDHAGPAAKAGKRMSLVDETFAAEGELLGDLGRVRDDDHAIVPDGQRHRQVLLDGDIAAELAVVSKIGDAEGALPQYGPDNVAPDASPGCECHIVVPSTDNDGVTHCYLARDAVTTASPS